MRSSTLTNEERAAIRAAVREMPPLPDASIARVAAIVRAVQRRGTAAVA